MFKIKDRITLGIVAGLVGNLVKTALDEVSLRKKISQRSFRETAAGVWVSKRSEATNIKGQIFGGIIDFFMGALGGVITTYLLSKTGKDKLAVKGIFLGIAKGSVITALLSGFPTNKVKPKDAASNLSYLVSHAAYGLVTAYFVSLLGHQSLFDANPINNSEDLTESTNERNLRKPNLVK